MQILVVEDNPANLALTSFLLEDEGYLVRAARDAHEAVAAVEAFTPDLILLDLQLPGIDGLDLRRRLKAGPATRDTPMVAVTAFAMKGDRERILAAGFDGYVAKPIERESFLRTVAECLRAAPGCHAPD